MNTDYSPFTGDSPELRALHAAEREGVIARDTFLAAVMAERGSARWLAWARFWLRVYGVALLLAGVIFFFAFNWADMHRFEKFGLIEVALIGTILLAWRRGWYSPAGQALLIASAVLVGALLAVFGQVYQTGADTWQLFFTWALLIAPWTVIANSAALWVLWLAVAETAAFLYLQAMRFDDDWRSIVLLAAVLPTALLCLRDGLLLKGRVWLHDAWLRTVLLIVALAMYSILAIAVMFNDDTGLAWFLPWSAAVAAGYAVYRWKMSDILALTFIVFDMAVVLMALIAKLLILADAGIEILWLYSLAIIAVVSVAFQWLRHLNAEMTREAAGREADDARA